MCLITVVFRFSSTLTENIKKKRNESSFSGGQVSMLLDVNWTFRGVWMLKAVCAGSVPVAVIMDAVVTHEVMLYCFPFCTCGRECCCLHLPSPTAAVYGGWTAWNQVQAVPFYRLLEEGFPPRTDSATAILSTSTSAQLLSAGLLSISSSGSWPHLWWISLSSGCRL